MVINVAKISKACEVFNKILVLLFTCERRVRLDTGIANFLKVVYNNLQ